LVLRLEGFLEVVPLLDVVCEITLFTGGEAMSDEGDARVVADCAVRWSRCTT